MISIECMTTAWNIIVYYKYATTSTLNRSARARFLDSLIVGSASISRLTNSKNNLQWYTIRTFRVGWYYAFVQSYIFFAALDSRKYSFS